MDEHSALFPAIPVSTIRAAQALYGRGNLYLRLGDHLNELARKLGPQLISIGLRDEKTALLSLLTIIQYVEKLTDAEIVEAIEQRMELRYALHLPTPGHRISPYSLCMFRRRILTNPACRGLFGEMFNTIYPEITPIVIKEETDIDDVLNSICDREVHAALMEAMYSSIEALSANHFHWLRSIARPHWYQRYNYSQNLSKLSGSIQELEVSRQDIQEDIQYLLFEIHESKRREIIEMPETKNLNLIWELLKEQPSARNCNRCINNIH
jgi:transposase